MATETAQAILPNAQVAPTEGASADEPIAPPPPETALHKQERRTIAVRDINTRIDELDKSMSGLTAAFGQSQETLDGSIRDLQRRSTQVASDIIGVVARLERNGRQQQEATQTLETRVQVSMAALREQIIQTDEEIGVQQQRIEQLEAGQASLQALHDALAADGRKQNAALRALAAETAEQVRINRTHIEGLQALHREQKAALQALSSDFDLLTERTNYLADHLTSLSLDVSRDRRLTRTRFIQVTAGTGVLAALVFAVMAWLQYHPTTVPAKVKAEIAALSATVQAQDTAQKGMNAEMQGIQTQLGSLGDHVAQQGNEIAAMQVAINHTSVMLQRLQRSEASVNARVSGLEQKTGMVDANGLRDGSWLASLPADHFSIQLLGSTDAGYLADVAKGHARALAGNPVVLARTTTQGGNWYSLFYGDFSSRAAANAAMKALPKSLQRNEPLVRSLGSIKSALGE